MKLSSNFIRFHDELGLLKTIDVFSKAGFEAIDFNADLTEYYTDAHDKAFYEDVKKYALDKGIVFAQTHAPFASSYEDEEKTEKRFYDIVKSMEHSSYLGAEMIVVHPCNHIDYVQNDCYDMMMEYNYNYYKKLIPYAEEYGIKIAIENIGRCVTKTPEGLLELLNMLPEELFTICYDVGHANIAGQDPVEMIKSLGNRIGCTHIHDNDGTSDAHNLPFSGIIDWEGVMKAFAEVDYKGNLNYESGYFVRNAPICLREDSAIYMAKVGKYLVERFWHYKNSLK